MVQQSTDSRPVGYEYDIVILDFRFLFGKLFKNQVKFFFELVFKHKNMIVKKKLCINQRILTVNSLL